MTIDEFFEECERRDLRLSDLLPGLIDRLAELGDEDALASQARMAEKVKL